MSAIMKKILFCISFVLIILSGKSQEIKFSANVSKKQLIVGERFQLQYSINSSASGFSGPDLSSFEVYSGPNQSSVQRVAALGAEEVAALAGDALRVP